MSTTRTYFDHNATTPISEVVRLAIPQALEAWGNPSSIHWEGRGPKTFLREARIKLASMLGAAPLELIFTSGGSEANNAVIKGVYCEMKDSGRNEYITSRVEHPSVLKAFQFLQTQGVKVHYLDVNRSGEIDLENYNKCLSEKTALVSIMYANNETGAVFPVKQMAALAKQRGALFHTDAVQALGKISLDLKDLGVDFASFSAHKFYALKGTGLLYSRRGTEWEPLIHGGGQERYRRGGTENALGIYAFGLMAEKLQAVPLEAKKMSDLRNHFEERVLKEIDRVTVNHSKALRLANTSSLILSDVDGETLLMSLDMKGFAVSTGAACSSGNPEPSPTLLAIGLSRPEAQNSLRVSFGWSNDLPQVDRFVEVLKTVVARLRSLNPNQEIPVNHV